MRNTPENIKTTTANTDKAPLASNEESAGCCACIFSLFSNREQNDRTHGDMSDEQFLRVAGMM